MKLRFWQSLVFALVLAPVAFAQDDSISLSVSAGKVTVDLPLVPGTDQYKVLGTTDLNVDFAAISSGLISGFTWTDNATAGNQFFKVQAIPMMQADTVSALVLNRLAYGPTPDELERVHTIGPDAYIAEQLAPEAISQALDIDTVVTDRGWQRVVATGTASATTFYVYLSLVGDAFVDDIKLVAGTNPDVGGNLFANGDFESALTGPWTVSTNLTDSAIVSTGVHGGAGALHLIASSAGSTKDSSIWQDLPVTVGNTYTLSYWWRPGTNVASGLTLRFSGSGIVSTPASSLATLLAERGAGISDLRAWHVLHGVRSKKQLEETMLQFLENHFVTQFSKSQDYLDNYLDGNEPNQWATYFEYQENKKWRAALEQPSCTFSNLMVVSAESPAMIIYLDTVGSKGNGSNIPNENYARELMELFTFGVDNGYDQNDIVLMSRIWTGWSVEIVDTNNEANPLAPMSTTLRPGGTNVNDRGQLSGVWAFNYKAGNHWTRSGTVLFPGKTVPDRFGAPYAGRNYEYGVNVDVSASRDWQQVVMTGTASSQTLYMYLNEPGDIYVDDIKIVAGSVPDVGANKVVNGDFETALTGPWTVSPNHASSTIVTTEAHGGTHSLHLIASEGGTTKESSVYESVALTAGATYTLSFWWKPGTNVVTSSTLRLSGSGIVANAPQRSGGNGLDEGYKVIGFLADQPFTQEFISTKLCRLFVHDNFHHGYDFTDPNLSPEGKLVRACMDTWENSTPKGQIRKVLQTIFNSDLFRSQGSAMHKVRTPLEYTIASVRALRSENADGTATSSVDGYSAASAIARMGNMKLFDRAEPDGYPEAAAPWISAGTLAERLRWVQALTIAASTSGRPTDAGSSSNDPVALLKKKLPSSQWKNAGAVADYFLSILLPGEGKANLDLYRTAAISFLNTADDGTTGSSFSALTDTSATYDTRVRGMVGAIMTSQRFHEQ